MSSGRQPAANPSRLIPHERETTQTRRLPDALTHQAKSVVCGRSHGSSVAVRGSSGSTGAKRGVIGPADGARPCDVYPRSKREHRGRSPRGVGAVRGFDVPLLSCFSDGRSKRAVYQVAAVRLVDMDRFGGTVLPVSRLAHPAQRGYALASG
jgi:hypothetical protein